MRWLPQNKQKYPLEFAVEKTRPEIAITKTNRCFQDGFPYNSWFVLLLKNKIHRQYQKNKTDKVVHFQLCLKRNGRKNEIFCLSYLPKLIF